MQAMSFAELTAEVKKRNKLLINVWAGNDKDERAIWYKASDHFILPNNPLPLVVTDKLEFTFTISHENLICNPDRTANVDGTFARVDLTDICYYVYSFVMSESERNDFIKVRNSGGIPFVY